MSRTADVRIGTAGWSIPRAAAFRFESAGTHLERYSRLLRCAEINSSFHRPHAAATYAKWRDSTPVDFRFAVKMPRTITHELKLQDARTPFVTFMDQTDGLAEKRGPILVQLPPSLSFDASVVTPFLDVVRNVYNGPMVCEPRHATWFSAAVASLLDRYRISRVAADPPPVPEATLPRVGRRSHTFGCTDRRGRTGHDMTRTLSRRLRRRSAGRPPRKLVCVRQHCKRRRHRESWELRERLIVESPLLATGGRSGLFAPDLPGGLVLQDDLLRVTEMIVGGPFGKPVWRPPAAGCSARSSASPKEASPNPTCSRGELPARRSP